MVKDGALSRETPLSWSKTPIAESYSAIIAITELYSAIIRSYKERCLTKKSSAEGVAILATSVDGEPTARPWRSRVSTP